MPEGGKLAIGLSNTTLTAAEALRIPDGRPGEFVLLTVADTGTGMSRETAKRIFEPFFTTKGAGKGTGLGLATCHGIIKQTAGMIAVTSTLGAGTTFFVYLPKAEGAAPTNVRSFDENELPRGRETILLVEDEEILRELGVQVLEGLGYRVIAADDGCSAIESLDPITRRSVDMVVTDLMMPRMNGRELMTWITKHVGHMRVLFMSGYTDDEIIRDAVKGAEVEYLQKPFTPAALARKIREVLDRPATQLAVPA
jgi:CheY-like chemotaxis protein